MNFNYNPNTELNLNKMKTKIISKKTSKHFIHNRRSPVSLVKES